MTINDYNMSITSTYHSPIANRMVSCVRVIPMNEYGSYDYWEQDDRWHLKTYKTGSMGEYLICDIHENPSEYINNIIYK